MIEMLKYFKLIDKLFYKTFCDAQFSKGRAEPGFIMAAPRVAFFVFNET